MWVFLNKGLVSIVQDRDNPARLLARARQSGLLESLVPRPEEVFHDPNADYPHRVFLSREETAALLAQQIERIDYDNFKNSVRDRKYHDACMRVWSAAKPLDES